MTISPHTVSGSLYNTSKIFSQKNKLQKCYYFSLGPGNNAELIKKILLNRTHWQEVDENSYYLNLRWQQGSKLQSWDRFVDRLDQPKKLINHFECHQVLSSKDRLLKTMALYCKVTNSFPTLL